MMREDLKVCSEVDLAGGVDQTSSIIGAPSSAA